MIKLTDEQWAKLHSKFCWCRVDGIQTTIHREILEKWLNLHTSGWWYSNIESSTSSLYIFEQQEDMVLFKVWVSDEPFKRDHGDME